jgi:hypothetical protein
MNSAGRDNTAAVLLLSARFSQHELQLHRRYRGDKEFRLLCDDYYDAVEAFKHWHAADDTAKTEEYRQLVEEYAGLVLAELERSPG